MSHNTINLYNLDAHIAEIYDQQQDDAEDVRLLLAFNPQGREELENEFHRERLLEVDELLAEGRDEPITFTGIVTEQNGDLWVVSGVKVQITPQSRMPAAPVSLGSTVFLQGKTNAQRYVEADYIEVVGWNLILPTQVPVETETPETSSHESRSATEEVDSGHQSERESGTSGEQVDDQSGSSEKDNQENSPEQNKKSEEGKDTRSSGGERQQAESEGGN